MSKYRLTQSPTDPASWYTCGPVSEKHAKNQWEAFGFRYKDKHGRPLLDYTGYSAKPKAKLVKECGGVSPEGDDGELFGWTDPREDRLFSSAPVALPFSTMPIAESAKSVVRSDRKESDNA